MWVSLRAFIISSAVKGHVEYLCLHTTWLLDTIPNSAARSYSALAELGFIGLVSSVLKNIILIKGGTQKLNL